MGYALPMNSIRLDGIGFFGKTWPLAAYVHLTSPLATFAVSTFITNEVIGTKEVI